MLAVQKGDISNVRMLCELGANVNAITQFGETPLHFTSFISNLVQRNKIIILLHKYKTV
jgi:hypothetical protein